MKEIIIEKDRYRNGGRAGDQKVKMQKQIVGEEASEG